MLSQKIRRRLRSVVDADSADAIVDSANALSNANTKNLAESRELLQFLMGQVIGLKEDVQVLKSVIKVLRSTSDKERAAMQEICAKLDADIDAGGASETDYEATISSALNS